MTGNKITWNPKILENGENTNISMRWDSMSKLKDKNNLLLQEMVALNHHDSYWRKSSHSNNILTEVPTKTHVEKNGYEKVQQFLKWLPTIGRMFLGYTSELAQRSLTKFPQVCSAGEYQQEACKVVQATFILFILSLLEEGIFTQLQGEGSRRTVNSLQLRSRLNEKVKRTLEDGEFILCEKNSPGEYEKDNRSTVQIICPYYTCNFRFYGPQYGRILCKVLISLGH